MKPRIVILTLGALLTSSACSTPSHPDDSDRNPSAGKGSASAGASGMSPASGGAPPASGGAGAGAGQAGASSAGAGSGTGGNSASGGGAGLGAFAGASGASGSGGGAGMAGGAGSSGGSGVGGAAGTSGSGGAGPAPVGSVENSSADCPVPELAEPAALPQIPKFPDPFTKIDGTRLTRRSEWRCRRQEILEQAEKYIYGERPPFDQVSGSVTSTQISVHVEAMGTAIDFSADVVLPPGEGPFPAIINLGAKGGIGGITLGESRILEQGVAVIYYDHYDLGQEGRAEQSRGQPNPGLFYDIYGGNHSAGLLMAWSWGASRLIDVIQQAAGDIIDPSGLGVTGCSRNGKGAFTVGLFDERIALTIPHETSTGGVPAYRIVDILNTERTDHNFYGLNWLSNDFEPFVYKNNVSNAVKLPIDTHSLVASIAPRGLLVLENPHQAQMSAPAGHMATLAGAEVFKALGLEGNVSYHSNVVDTPHCSYKTEYTELLVQNISRFLKHEGDAPGRIEASTQGALQLSDWKDWETPALEDDLAR